MLFDKVEFKNRLEFKGAVVGMAYGDGHLKKKYTPNSNSALVLTHGRKQKEYLEWKADLLRYLTNVKVSECVSNRSAHDKNPKKFPDNYVGYRAQTGRHPFYTAIRDRMYLNSRKVIDDHLIKVLSPLGLAIWFLDDGTLDNSNPSHSRLWWGLCKYSRPELELLVYRLHQRWGFRWKIAKRPKNYVLVMNKWADILKFYDVIEPWIPPYMAYKSFERTKPPAGNNWIKTSG